MSDEQQQQNDTTGPAPLPRMSEAEIAAAREKIAGYLEEAAANGIRLRAITGQVMRLAGQAGIDLEALGGDIDGIDDEAYYEQVVRAAWLLMADESRVVEECLKGAEDNEIAHEASLWALRELDSIEKEGAVLRAFIARWLEYRIEMQILRQRSEG